MKRPLSFNAKFPLAPKILPVCVAFHTGPQTHASQKVRLNCFHDIAHQTLVSEYSGYGIYKLRQTCIKYIFLPGVSIPNCLKYN